MNLRYAVYAMLSAGLVALATISCDRMAFASFAVRPTPVTLSDSSHTPEEIVARIAKRYGLDSIASDNVSHNAWTECFVRESLFLCGKTKNGEIQFRMRQWTRFTKLANSLRSEVLDSLRATFGADRVRECRWLVHADPTQGGCAPADSTHPR